MRNDLHLLVAAGYPEARPLAEGMEGSVYLLSEETVGKVPHSIVPLEHDAFGTALASSSLPFAAPRPLGTSTLGDGRTMKIERRLPGRPLNEFYDPDEGILDQRVVDAVGDVLDGLRDLSFEVPSRTILDGERYEAAATSWTDRLVELGRRRFARFGDQLEVRDHTVRRTVNDLLTFVASRSSAPPRVIHGDICGANVLVNDDCQVTAVIDWGFFSVLAEPALDAAIACAIFDMYGPRAAHVEATLTAAIVERFDLNREVVLAYKGVYALMTSNVYSPDGADGHFVWCSAMLSRPDVQGAAALLARGAADRIEVA